MNTLKIIAAVLCFVFLLAFLFMPLMVINRLTGESFAGASLLSWSFWGYFVLAAGIAMGVCALLLNGKISGIICMAGAFMPLVAFFAASAAMPADMVRAYSVQTIGMGIGAVLPIFPAVAAGVLCFLSELNRRPKKHSAGLGAETDDEW